MPANKTVIAVGKPDLVAVRYVDGAGKDETRLAVRMGGKHFLLRETVGSANLLQAASDWLEEGIAGFKQPKKPAKGGGVKASKAG
jgi:hypothetical protein